VIAPLGQPLAGRFVIEREVGRGGVGIVYRAHDEVTGDPVALKVIALPGVDAGEEARFRREGRACSRLPKPLQSCPLPCGDPGATTWTRRPMRRSACTCR